LYRDSKDQAEVFSTKLETLFAETELPPPPPRSKVIFLGGIATKIAWHKVRDGEAQIYDQRRMSGGVAVPLKWLQEHTDHIISMARDNPIKARAFVDPRSADYDELTGVITGGIFFIRLLKQLKKRQCLVSTQSPRFGVPYMVAMEEM
jgi:hypothetical protein